jgi:hypothetical protein
MRRLRAMMGNNLSTKARFVGWWRLLLKKKFDEGSMRDFAQQVVPTDLNLGFTYK